MKETLKRLMGDTLLRPWWRFRKKAEAWARTWRRSRLKTQEFTVISNNCFGGFVYQRYGLPYKTPTAGVFFMPKDFLRLLERPQTYFSLPLEFVEPMTTPHAEVLRADDEHYGQYPVARLGDIYVYFMHYATVQEAQEKWVRRCARICWNRVLYKFCDQNGATKEDIAAFDALPHKNKVCFCAKAYPEYKSVVTLRADAGQPCVRAQTEEHGYRKDYPLTRAINQLVEEAGAASTGSAR